MARAKQLLTVAMVLGVGVTAGLVQAVDGAPASPAAQDHPELFLLQPATADRPLVREPPVETEAEPVVLQTLVGSASFYANSLAGRRTASGVRYDPREMVAAHRTLPFGSRLRVTNQANGQSVEVRVVDRGPFARGRVLDLSRRAAEKLDFVRRGHTQVKIEVLE